MSTNFYTGLVTSEHNQRPKYMAMMNFLTQFFVDYQLQMSLIPLLFDYNIAVGDQLDKIGVWIGASRTLVVAGATVVLSDSNYRLLLSATIAANHWDGTIPGMYEVFNDEFAQFGISLLLQDNQDMTMTPVFVSAGTIDPVAVSLIKNGNILMRPAGVGITAYYTTSTLPVFGFDVSNSTIAGFDVGTWAIIL